MINKKRGSANPVDPRCGAIVGKKRQAEESLFMKRKKRLKIMRYPISLEVNENSSSDLGNQDKQ